MWANFFRGWGGGSVTPGLVDEQLPISSCCLINCIKTVKWEDFIRLLAEHFNAQGSVVQSSLKLTLG